VRAGFYFGFLSFYTQCLSLPAAVGVGLYVTDADPASPNFEVGIFSCLLLILGMLFMKAWRRHQTALATRWLRFSHATGQVGRVRPADFAHSVAATADERSQVAPDVSTIQDDRPQDAPTVLRWALGKCLAWSVHAVSVVFTWISVIMLHYLNDHFPRLVNEYSLFDRGALSVGGLDVDALLIEYLPTLIFIVFLALIGIVAISTHPSPRISTLLYSTPPHAVRVAPWHVRRALPMLLDPKLGPTRTFFLSSFRYMPPIGLGRTSPCFVVNRTGTGLAV
jgi:hypothetical protein